MRIIYWNTSCFEPEIEAISKEIFQLACRFSKSWVFGVNPHYVFRWSIKKRCLGFHPNFDRILRFLIPLVERYGDINHIYGEPCPWIFSQTLKKKPILLTIASEKGQVNETFFDRCHKIIVQTESFRKKLLSLGIDAQKVELLYPGITFPSRPLNKNGAPQKCRPKVLFATAPRTEEEMNGRGVNLLLQSARQSPEVSYRLLYRPWKSGYTSLKPTQQFIQTHGLNNVQLTNDAVKDMQRVYAEHDFVVIPYTNPDGGKECPNSLVEGLACGLPALIYSVSPFAYFIEEHHCGVVFDPTPEEFVKAIERGLSRYPELSHNAERTARNWFSQTTVFQKHESIYQEMRRISV